MALLLSPIDPSELPAFFLTLVIVLALLAALRSFVLKLPERGGYRGQLALFLLVGLGLMVLLIAMPLKEGIRDNVFSLVGLVLSAAVALSSTTFLGNLIAGGMLRTIRHFQLGDWIRVEGHFGRVTERGLLHTEIQTEDRDLTTIPNLLLATQPVKVVRQSGTIISAKVGIGYDVPHERVEAALLRAAAATGLEDAFASVLELGDFAVTYRVAGKLGEVDRLISRRSKLRRAMLDALHADGIEIMSPSYMTVAQREADHVAVPDELPESIGGVAEVKLAPEEVAFDKADVAKGLETKRAGLTAVDEQIVDLEARASGAEGEERARLEAERDRLHLESERLAAELAADEARLKEGNQ